MLITTVENIGRPFEVIGLVEGSMVQSKHIGKDIMAGFKTLVGGELKAYTEMMEESRKIAIARMTEQAQGMGADAVIGMRYATSSVMQGAAEMTAYGTAVKFK